MRIRKYRPDDLECVLNIDGSSSKRRADKLFMVETCDAYYCYAKVAL
ncbi:MAG: hypothetical protein AAB414_04225 [Patescibacteria group bacterium]